VYSIQLYVIKFVSGFLWVLKFPPQKNTDRQYITEILLKVVLDTITLTLSITPKKNFKYCLFSKF